MALVRGLLQAVGLERQETRTMNALKLRGFWELNIGELYPVLCAQFSLIKNVTLQGWLKERTKTN